MPYSQMSEMSSCVVTVSQPGEHKIAGKWFEVPQSIGSPHASFLQLTPSRLADPDRAADARPRGVATGADRVALRSAAPGGVTPYGPFGFSEPQGQLAGGPAAFDSVAGGLRTRGQRRGETSSTRAPGFA
jgi:hypothetical protein